MALILDVSNVNAEPVWPEVIRHGAVGAYLKASEGETFNDWTFGTRRDEAERARAHAAGIHVGAYHFARPDLHPGVSGAVAEAKHFASVVKKVRVGELRPVLDFETPAHSNAFEWIKAFNKQVKRELGVWPGFYSYSAMIEGLKLPRPVGAFLWLASYGRNDGSIHPAVTPRPWKRWSAHQFSSNCLLGGCKGRVDLSEAHSIRPLLAHPAKSIGQVPVMARKRRAAAK